MMKFLVFLFVCMVFVLGCVYSESMDSGSMKDKVTSDDKMAKSDETMKKPSESMTKEVKGKYTGTILAGTSAPFIDFNKADYDTALASGKTVVLYFYAGWCPICRKEFPNAQAAFNELTNDKVVGFRVNYNDDQTDANEIALARQFGVPYQHTKVFVKNGKQILKSVESWDKDRYLREINAIV